MIKRLCFILLLAGIILPVVCFSQAAGNDLTISAQDTDKVMINIRPTWGGMPLQPGIEYYVNAHNDTLYIDEFRIYISNLSFTGKHAAGCVNSHLFDATDAETYRWIVKNIPPGRYDTLQFIAGVDSEANTSGANGGDLDPVKGMYWAWNSGYIMAKIEGHSSACHTLHHAFEFHIGGYMPPYNTARTVKLPADIYVGSSLPVISMNADVAIWLNDIDLSKTNSVLIPGKDAAAMADKYARMFSIKRIAFTPINPR